MKRRSPFQPPRLRRPGNVGRFYLWNFLVGTAVLAIVSILVLFWLARGLGLGQIMILMSTYSVSILIFEIPTGVLADRFTRKGSLAIGAMLQPVAGLIMLSTNYFPALLGAFALIGLGFAFTTGAGEALIYDFLKQEEREAEAQRVFGAGLSWFQIGGVTGAVITGLLVARFELSAAVWAHNVLFLAAAAVALWLDEPILLSTRRESARAKSFRSQVAGLLADTRSSFGIVICSRPLKALMAVGLIVVTVWSVTEITFTQPYMVEFGLRAEQIAYIWAAFSAAAAVFAALSNRLGKILHGDERRFILVIASLLVAALIAFVNAPTVVVAIASVMLIFIVAGGLAPPFLNAGVNRRIQSEHRASVLSIGSMASGLFGFFVLPLFGLLADGYSLEVSMQAFQWSFIALLAVVVVAAWLVVRPAVAGQDAGVRR